VPHTFTCIFVNIVHAHLFLPGMALVSSLTHHLFYKFMRLSVIFLFY
jgi:hypothetical protein